MSFLQWSDRYSVGITSFDRQHQQLIILINQLHDGMTQGKGNDILGPILDKLVEYTTLHFKAEEAALQRHGYPQLQQHIAEHKKLTDQVIDFRNKFHSGQVRISVQVMQFLKDWLLNHIQSTDRLYGAFLQEHGAA